MDKASGCIVANGQGAKPSTIPIWGKDVGIMVRVTAWMLHCNLAFKEKGNI